MYTYHLVLIELETSVNLGDILLIDREVWIIFINQNVNSNSCLFFLGRQNGSVRACEIFEMSI